jgi:hypothetical protein
MRVFAHGPPASTLEPALDRIERTYDGAADHPVRRARPLSS